MSQQSEAASMNRTQALPVVLVTLCFLSACGPANRADQQDTVRIQIDSLVKALQRREVGTVEALQLPRDASLLMRVTPETIEQGWTYKSTVQHIYGVPADNLATILTKVAARRIGKSSDLRSAMLFYSLSDNRRICAIYFDRTGRAGEVDGISATFGENLFSHLKAVLSKYDEW